MSVSIFISSGFEWPPIGKNVPAHSTNDMFSKFKCLVVNFVFPTSGLGVGFFF